MRKLLALISLAVLVVLAGCGDEATTLSENEITVGVTAGPHEQILEKVKELAAEEDLTVNIEVFTEYVIPNTALDEGELDLNSYQHQPFLDNAKSDRGYEIEAVATTVNFPMGIYSTEIADVSQLQEGDKVALPNDPTNGARALILFEAAGLITLKEGVGAEAMVLDIEENPLNLDFIELEASQIPRQLEEVAAAAINTNFAIEHGFVPTEDAIYIEPSDSPWVNLIVAREENSDDPVIEKFIRIYQSDEVKQFIEDTFEGSVVASW
ncbi:lipoprotein [Halolactibacillus alkaliphilus]|uniref:Lipoprotein n=1 Tax=Halolactibacillus alkaliphilus TaxID=442899 RepID=A0A511WXL8_9BACI|nr:MetQ/NlpA family ABC transporter substrate-binding protein [Halolactibacillus alkaliphilus]GEN55866.1 lipoprotein [Halolactibacillus alkaliphilus]GGN65828.1 lipoprotein [Halolactibacillus alkaliphilus]SFO66362.1 D-methionine transport system substrate-binding protein [Halolactibacillus alkaliphilus]